MVNKPIDQPDRERFVSKLDKNFSVVAAAGSGKTRAITDRIVEIARSSHACDWLPELVVVAFTNRAADEMQQRARAEVLRAGISLEVLAAFNRTFFGTIHSFSVRLLETYGHHLGLPPAFGTNSFNNRRRSADHFPKKIDANFFGTSRRAP
jgi:superfamily I DNA/RNA helicase